MAKGMDEVFQGLVAAGFGTALLVSCPSSSGGGPGGPGPGPGGEPAGLNVGTSEVNRQVIDAAAGSGFTCAVFSGGSMTCWGAGTDGRLGNGIVEIDEGTGMNPSTRASMVPLLFEADVRQVAAGLDHACALFDNGSLRCWGNAIDGKLGYGNENDIARANESGVLFEAGVSQVSAGGWHISGSTSANLGHTCAVFENGSLRCWGSGDDGRLGYGNENDQPSAAAAGLLFDGDVSQVSAGGSRETGLSVALQNQGHTCALFVNGTLKCWGGADFGQLGYGSEARVNSAAAADSLFPGENVSQVSAGGKHTCVVFSNGSLKCWGKGDDGRLGYGDTDDLGDNETANSLPDLFSAGVSQVSAGHRHSCAVFVNGSLKCWGMGARNALGYGNGDSLGNDEHVSTIPFLFDGGVAEVYAGTAHTCVRFTDGGFRCWGKNEFFDPFGSPLGYGSFVDYGGTPETRADLIPNLFSTYGLRRVTPDQTFSLACPAGLESGLPAAAGIAGVDDLGKSWVRNSSQSLISYDLPLTGLLFPFGAISVSANRDISTNLTLEEGGSYNLRFKELSSRGAGAVVDYLYSGSYSVCHDPSSVTNDPSLYRVSGSFRFLVGETPEDVLYLAPYRNRGLVIPFQLSATAPDQARLAMAIFNGEGGIPLTGNQHELVYQGQPRSGSDDIFLSE